MGVAGRVLHHQPQPRADVPFGFPPGFEFPSRFRTIRCFDLQEMLGQGSFGVVYRARDRATGEAVAIKRQRYNQPWVQEVKSMWMCRNIPTIVKYKEIVVGDIEDNLDNVEYIYIVMELAEEGALSSLVWDKSRKLDEHRTRELMSQLLQGVAGLHYNGIIHQDLKTENLLLTRTGSLKIGDLGISRFFDPRYPVVKYKGPVVTRWYRAPELLLRNCTEYTAAIDIWSVGCIMTELICRRPLFPGNTEEDQLKMIGEFLNFPETLWEMLPPDSLSDTGYDLLTKMLVFDPGRRITAEQALQHPWFREEQQEDSSSQDSMDKHPIFGFLFPPRVR